MKNSTEQAVFDSKNTQNQSKKRTDLMCFSHFQSVKMNCGTQPNFKVIIMTQENDIMILSLCEDGISIMFRGDMASYPKDGSIKCIVGIIDNKCLPRRIILRDLRNQGQIAPHQMDPEEYLAASC